MSETPETPVAEAVGSASSKKGARTGPSKPAAPSAAAKPSPKKATKLAPKSKSAATEASMRNAELAIKAIEKATGQRPIGFNHKPLPCVSSGSTNIDHIIGGVLAPDKSGPLCPGYPRGRITEVYGPESSGKTTLALEAIVEVQRKGGSAMFLDFEHALAHKYARDLGVDFDPRRLMLCQPDYVEQGLEMMRVGLMAGVDLIVVDSVAAMVPKADMEKSFEDPDKIGARALRLASSLPKIVKLLKSTGKNPLGTAVIFINQTRASISTGPGGGAGDTTSGGKALKFFAYLRLQTNCIRSERVKYKDPVTKKEKNAPFGSHTQVKVVKSKIDAKQGQAVDIFIRFGKGIDDVYTMIESGVAHRLIKKTGAFFELGEQKFQGREKLRAFLEGDKAALDELKHAVLKAVRSQAEDDPITQGGLVTEEDEVDALIAASLGSEADAEDEQSPPPEEVELEDE